MPFFLLRNYYPALLVLALTTVNAIADEVVRINLGIGATEYDVDIVLFGDNTPITVQNFLNYVDITGANPRYDDSFIHRSVPDFVIQGGGYTYNPAFGAFSYDTDTDTYTGGLQRIQKDPPITNEFQSSGLSNLRGTVAMAKLSSDPDSATSEWFINLEDNSENLDNQNGGFTVFGEVLDNGMAVLDTAAAVPTYDKSSIHFAMDNIPLDDYTSNDPISNDNLVRIISITAIQRPTLYTDPDPIDFGIVAVGETGSITAKIYNNGNSDLIMDADSLATLSSPFSISSEDCSNTTLVPDSSAFCSITIQYAPVAIALHTTKIEITPPSNPLNIVLSQEVSGEGVPSTPVLHVRGEVTSIDYGDAALGSVSSRDITVENRGGGILNLDGLTISGVDSSSFSLDTGCTNTTQLATGETCVLKTAFAPLSEGQKNASLSITSNAGQHTVVLAGNSVGPEVDYNTPILFPYTAPGTTSSDVVEIRNTGLADLVVTSLEITGTDAADFTQMNTCPNVATLTEDPLGTNQKCLIIISFSPLTGGPKNASLIVGTTDSDESTIVIPLQADQAVPDIDTAPSITTSVNQVSLIPGFGTVLITNTGIGNLVLNNVNLTGGDAPLFSIANNCPGQLLPNENCSISIRLDAVSTGTFTTGLLLETNDPDEPDVVVEISGVGDSDVDGVHFSEEQAASNAGDGNNDGISDDIQNNVASFVAGSKGDYVSVIAPPGSLLGSVKSSDVSQISAVPPAGLVFHHGMLQFEIAAPPSIASATIQVGVLLPPGDVSSVFYNYGVTADNTEPHWYQFQFDGTTGAEYIGLVRMESPGGNTTSRKMYILYLIDGERGDNDLEVNGVIDTFGGTGVVGGAGSDGTGNMSWYVLILCCLAVTGCRRYL